MRNAFTKALFFSGQGNVERWTLHRDVEFIMATFFNTTKLYSIMFWIILNRFRKRENKTEGIFPFSSLGRENQTIADYV